MKRLPILAAVVLAAGASGCRHCAPFGGTTAYRPYQAPAPCCTPTESFGQPVYSAPGATVAPTLSAPATTFPGQTFPGPEAYTPAM